MKETVSEDYLQRTNRALDYIVQNLSSSLRLDDVARAACFSPFHFYRVFQSLMGETLNAFVKRQRLERALYLMSHAPNSSLTAIALECGFSSSSDFPRSFKQRFEVAPSNFNVQDFRDHKRAEFEATLASHEKGPKLPRLPKGENPDGFDVHFRDLPARTVAYMRVLDPYQGTGVMTAYERMLAWAEERGLADNQWLGYMWEDPEIVVLNECRYDVALEVDGSFKAEGEIGRFDFPAMRVAEIELSGNIELEQRALDWITAPGFPPADASLVTTQPSKRGMAGLLLMAWSTLSCVVSSRLSRLAKRKVHWSIWKSTRRSIHVGHRNFRTNNL